ncbi:MAG: RdgB/HAM1 family non-canonical purine NTP pyrophosphatase [Oscillatoriales cyanobacterium]|nr:MAG: RdgB/HAM1 family non-canonical purine NTP pyrophosphatase [Oscillatoriales cyanobacterium]
MPRLVVATGNPGKLAELQAYLNDTGWELALKPPELEIEETGTTFLENARLKASQIALATGEWAIADDSGLAVTALNGAPGLYSARYGATDAERINRVLTGLAGQGDRSAHFICALVVVRPDGTVAAEAEGICPGEITEEPRGQNGFGYDPIFGVPELGCTYAEMSAAQKHDLSHRGRAIALLKPQLAALG